MPGTVNGVCRVRGTVYQGDDVTRSHSKSDHANDVNQSCPSNTSSQDNSYRCLPARCTSGGVEVDPEAAKCRAGFARTSNLRRPILSDAFGLYRSYRSYRYYRGFQCPAAALP